MTSTCPSESVAQSRAARAQRPALASVGVPWGYAGLDKFAASPADRVVPITRILNVPVQRRAREQHLRKETP